MKAYAGDMKDAAGVQFTTKVSSRNVAGLHGTMCAQGTDTYASANNLQYEVPADHAQDPKEPGTSSIDAPLHKLPLAPCARLRQAEARVPSSANIPTRSTPRYLNDKSLLPINTPLFGRCGDVDVGRFKRRPGTGFTRDFTQSQAFQHHFGPKKR